VELRGRARAGRPRIVDEAQLRAILDDMVAQFDRTGWRFEAPEDYERRMLDAIAGFEIELSSIEGKWKLSQNRPVEDRRRVIDWLEEGDDAGRAVAALMRGQVLE
jgi:transcriptional regulator